MLILQLQINKQTEHILSNRTMNVSLSHTGINRAILSLKVPGMTLCVSFEEVTETTQSTGAHTFLADIKS